MKALGWVALAVGVSACTTGIDDAPVDGGEDAPVVGKTSSSGSEAGAGTADDAGAGFVTAGHDAAPDVGGGSSTQPGDDAGGTPPRADAADASGAGLVINEVCGKGVNYVELFNAGGASIDLSGWGVTEAKDDDAGVPGSPKSPALFPSGTLLAAGAYALATSAPSDGGASLMGCPASVCVTATWGVSNSSGATVYLLDPSGATVAQVPFPRATTGDGQSWGRLPNATGAFALNTQTPGVVNAGP